MKRVWPVAVLLVLGFTLPALADNVGSVVKVINALFGGPINALAATTGQALVKQADGSWKGAAPAASPSSLASVLAVGATTGGTSMVFSTGDGLAFHGATPVADSIVSAPGVGFRVASGGSTSGDLTVQPLDSTGGSIGAATLLKGGNGNGAGFGGAVSVVGGTGAALGGLALLQGGTGQTPGGVTVDTGTSTTAGVGTITFKAAPAGAAGATVATIVGNQQKLSGTNSLWTVSPTWADGGSASSGGAATLYVNPTYNFTGTSSRVLAALQIDAVETSLPASGSPTHYLLRARAGSAGTTDEFYVTNIGNTYANSFTAIAGGTIGFSAVASVGLNPADAVISRQAAHILQVGTASTPNANGFLAALGLATNNATTSGINMGFSTTGYLTGGSAVVFGWTSTHDSAASLDLGLSREAAGVLQALNPGSLTSSAALRIYNTTDAASGVPTNAEWLETAWSSNLCTITTAKAGSGTLRKLNIECASGGVTVRAPNGAELLTVDDTGGNHFFAVRSANDAWIRNGLVLGGSTIGSGSFAINSGGQLSTYKSVSTTGWGLPAIYAQANATAQTGANTSVATYTCGAADGGFDISATMNVTAISAATLTITCAYTDVANVAQTLVLPVQLAGGTAGTYLATGSIAATGDYSTPVHNIRVKASTAITIKTTFSGTSVTYSASGTIKQTG